MSPKREVRYFDYNYEAALAFTGYGFANVQDLRTMRKTDDYRYDRCGDIPGPRKGKLVLWGVD